MVREALAIPVQAWTRPVQRRQSFECRAAADDCQHFRLQPRILSWRPLGGLYPIHGLSFTSKSFASTTIYLPLVGEACLSRTWYRIQSIQIPSIFRPRPGCLSITKPSNTLTITTTTTNTAPTPSKLQCGVGPVCASCFSTFVPPTLNLFFASSQLFVLDILHIGLAL